MPLWVFFSINIDTRIFIYLTLRERAQQQQRTKEPKGIPHELEGGKKWKEGGFLWWDNRFPPTLTLISWRYQWKRAKEGETLLLQEEEEVVVMAVVECDFTFPTNRTADPDVVRLLNVSAQLRPCVQKRPSLSFSSTTLGCRCTTRERPRRCGQPQVAVVVRTL